ncbi:MAG: HoxN/HupN/NixA family nickel/cobalt transporter [Sphingomonadales bacterium]|nr:HoxN/HupN/NixA family nickel/cobalt transporter [Sphingomonadales bacterium]MBD3772628.1 HoxN/HupN/NixA family nickel/cobalt transporter [Paracoccaceae bacterium]
MTGMTLRNPLVGIFAPLLAANVLLWAGAWLLFGDRPVLLGACALAWTLGLRHAVDADHIAAIDGATRRLMHRGHGSRDRGCDAGQGGAEDAAAQPMLTGLYFSLGHSTVVWLASLGVALAAGAASPWLGGVGKLGEIVGPGTSIVFLFAIALANLAVLAGLLRAARRGSRGSDSAAELDERLVPGGPIARLAQPLFRLVTRSRHMFAIGVLFGLGFDTATEIMVLGISASAATQGTAIWSILMFPALFTAAMALVDTADSAMMARAYGWAFDQPQRKLTYNIAVTAASVLLALLIGLAQLASMLPLGGEGLVDGVLERGGYVAIAGFFAIWLAARLLPRFARHRAPSA